MVLAALALAACMVSPSFAAPDRVPCVISDDFETGELYGWESYPYAQDIGYEPFTIPQKSPAHNGSKYSLAKIQTPNDIVELWEGFTKQLDLWTTADTRFKVAVFLMADRPATDLELSICLLDGRRYLHHVANAEANRWLELDVPLGRFTWMGKALESGCQVQAVTIKAFYPSVTHLMSYTICIDDFSLNGERPRRFVGVNPSSTMFEMFGFSILNRHFFYGDTIGITVKPEDAPGKGALNGVTCDLLDPSGKKVVSGLAMASSGGNWSNDKVYTLRQSDPRGQWTINFAGKDMSGKEVAWGFRFLMPGDRLTASHHPRLEFSRDELVKLKADSSPETRKLLAGAVPGADRIMNVDISSIREADKTETEALTGGPYIKGSGAGERLSWFGPIRQLAPIITGGAERYALTGDEAAGRKAKEALLKLSSFSQWNHPWHEAHGMHTYYPFAYYAVGPAGEGFDLLYPLLSEQEKQAIRQGIMQNAILPFYRDMVEQNRMPSSLSNHIAVIVTGMVKAAAAIYGDDPQNPCLEPYLSGILAKTKQFIDRTYYPDGGYGEPTTYQDMATRDLVEALHILENNYGIDYTTTTNIRDTWLYPLYVTYSNGRYPDFGDVSPSYNLAGPVFRWLSYRTKNPYTYAFIQKADASGRSRGGLLSHLWKVEGVTPKSREELVPSHMFPVKGNMVMRSGWSDESTVMIFKAGPNSNHYHVDQGTFYLMTNGEELVSDAGHGSSYYANLYYPCYYTQTIGHNCMLVDGDPQSQVPADYENGVTALRDYPRMLHSFAGWNTAEAEGDLTCVYKGKVQNYTRSFLYMKPDILFLYDKVTSPEEHTYSWLFHAEHTDGKSSISGGKNSIDITRTRSSLHMDILTPEITSSRVRNSDRDESFITLTGQYGTRDAEFLAVLFPRATKEAPASDKPVSTLLNPSGWTGAKVEKAGTVTVALFRKSAPSGVATVEGFTTDAERFSAETDRQGNLSRFFFRGTSFGKSGNVLFTSARPLSASAVFVSGGLDVETESDTATELTLNTGKAPSGVTVNDQPVKGFKFDRNTGMVRVAVPAGHAMVKIR
jgi:hypothetical protein